jgi:hypothetical protein
VIRLTDEQWERIQHHFPEENIADGRPGRKPVPANAASRIMKQYQNQYQSETVDRFGEATQR